MSICLSPPHEIQITEVSYSLYQWNSFTLALSLKTRSSLRLKNLGNPLLVAGCLYSRIFLGCPLQMRIFLAAVLASGVSSSNGFAEPHEDLIATSQAEDEAGFIIVPNNEELVVESEAAPIDIDESLEGSSAVLDDVESPDHYLEKSVTEMFSQMRKSVSGMMERGEIPRIYIEKEDRILLYLIAESLVSISVPTLKTTLLEGSFTHGISQCIFFDWLRIIVDWRGYRAAGDGEGNFNEKSIAEISALKSAAEAENRCEERLTLKGMSDVLRAPSTQFALKEMLEGFKKSIIGLMTLKDIRRYDEALPFILIATVVACDMQFQARLFQSGLLHFLLYDVVKSTLSNGGLIPNMSHFKDAKKKKSNLIKIVSVLASFMLLGAPSKSFSANVSTGIYLAVFLELLKLASFGDIVGGKKK